LGFESIGLLTQHVRLYVLPVRRTSGLPLASFRFRLTTDTLAIMASSSSYQACSGLAPPSKCALPGALNKKEGQLLANPLFITI